MIRACLLPASAILRMRYHWLKREAEAFRVLDSRLQRGDVFFLRILEKSSKSLISCKCKCRSFNYKLHLHIAAANGFPSVYCATVIVQPLLHNAFWTLLKVAVQWGSQNLHLILIHILEPTRVFIPNDISIGSVVFQGSRTWPTDKHNTQTHRDRPRYSMCSNRALSLDAMRPKITSVQRILTIGPHLRGGFFYGKK